MHHKLGLVLAVDLDASLRALGGDGIAARSAFHGPVELLSGGEGHGSGETERQYQIDSQQYCQPAEHGDNGLFPSLQNGQDAGANKAVQRPDQKAADRGQQHRDSGGRTGGTQEGHGGEGAQHGHDDAFQHQEEQAQPLLPSGSEHIHQAGHGEGCHGAHGEGQEKGQRLDAQRDGVQAPGTLRTGGAVEEQGDQQAEGDHTGGDVGVVVDAGDADAAFVAHLLGEVPGAQAVHHPDKAAGQELQGGAVNAQQGDGGQNGGHGLEQPPQARLGEAGQHQQKQGQGHDLLGAFVGGIGAEMGPQAGEQAYAGIQDHGGCQRGKAVPQPTQRLPANGEQQADRRHADRALPGQDRDGQKQQDGKQVEKAAGERFLQQAFPRSRGFALHRGGGHILPHGTVFLGQEDHS